jgi:hypothetical protein
VYQTSKLVNQIKGEHMAIIAKVYSAQGKPACYNQLESSVSVIINAYQLLQTYFMNQYFGNVNKLR